MPKPGPAYPISSKWRVQVRKAIAALIKDPTRDDVTSANTFAIRAGIGRSSLSEALNDESTQSTVMPQINAALGWRAPRVLSTPDELEMWAAVEMMDEREIGRMLERAEQKLASMSKSRRS